MNTHLLYSARHAFIATLLIVMLGVSAFFAFEPSVGRSQSNPHDFVVTQQITSELSFLVEATDVTMSPAIAGVTGGVSSGTTTTRVLTNDSAGYYLTLKFASTTANPGVAMNGNTQGGYISNYTPASPGIPDFGFGIAANTAEFAYTVGASTTADLDTTFRNNGAVCNNNSGGDTAFNCWLNPTTSPSYSEVIVNRGSETPGSGATTSIAFRLQVAANPAPAVPEDTYTATATLTAVSN